MIIVSNDNIVAPRQYRLTGSPFERLERAPSATKGAEAKKILHSLVDAVCLDVERAEHCIECRLAPHPSDRRKFKIDYDLKINDYSVEVKSSFEEDFLWQQMRPHYHYDKFVLMGFNPMTIELWIFDKSIVPWEDLALVKPQHDLFSRWIRKSASPWLKPYHMTVHLRGRNNFELDERRLKSLFA